MATTDTSKLERLPWELWEKIAEQLPVPGILGLKQVNRGFCDLICRSLRIQHKLDLYTAGLEPNWATGVTIADSIKALEEYHSKWDSFDIEEHQMTVRMPISERQQDDTAGGVYGVAKKHEILFFTLPSNSRGIQSRNQTISFDFRVTGFAFYPQADVVVVTGQTDRIMELRLITMAEGLPHPSANKKIIECVTGSISSLRGAVSLSITSQRLASMVENSDPKSFQLNVWDWITGEQLFEHRSPHHELLGFLDDYRLAIKVTPSSDGVPPRLSLLDAERVSSGVPVQTWFYGPTSFQRWAWIVEAGGHMPSPQEILTAPFYPDPSQRIIAMSLNIYDGFLVMKVETLLRLARERAGGKIQWQEWSPYLIQPYLKWRSYPLSFLRSWVSGFRLFRVSTLRGDGPCRLYVYDFSARGRMKHFEWIGGSHKVMFPSVKKRRLCWNDTNISHISFGHDSVVFLRVHLNTSENEYVAALCLQTL